MRRRRAIIVPEIALSFYLSLLSHCLCCLTANQQWPLNQTLSTARTRSSPNTFDVCCALLCLRSPCQSSTTSRRPSAPP